MLGKINKYIEEGLVTEQVHPENPDVKIYNYTQKCQFEGAWDEVTMQCRGLIFDTKTGKQLSNPFPKFFNYEEHIAKGLSVPHETPIIHQKFDGSLGILYWLNDLPWIATRGSFASDQAIWATNWFRLNANFEDFNKDYTYLFEIIYPENRIVVSYDFSGLALIAVREIGGTDVLVLNQLGMHQFPLLRGPFEYPMLYKPTDFAALKAMNLANQEGFVIHYPNADLRLKIKFEDYVRLHKIMTGLSAIGIWEALREGKEISIDNVPDEFFKWFTETKDGLNNKFSDIWHEAYKDYLDITESLGYPMAPRGLRFHGQTRKHFADKAAQTKYPSILFAMLDGKDYREIIWKMIRPRGQQTFKVDIDS